MNGNGASAAARSMRTQKLGGKTFAIGRLTFQDLIFLKEEAAKNVKRSLLKTYTDNMDLVPESQRATCMQQAFDRAEKITADTLPPKLTWVVKVDPSSGKPVLNTGERFFHKESGQWIEKGKPLTEQREIEYSGWWAAYTTEGSILAAWLSVKNCPGQESITLDEITALAFEDALGLGETANAIGEITQQQLGNSQPPAALVGAAR